MSERELQAAETPRLGDPLEQAEADELAALIYTWPTCDGAHKLANIILAAGYRKVGSHEVREAKAMSEPTQQDRERAKEWARACLSDHPAGYDRAEIEAARVLLALLAERGIVQQDENVTMTLAQFEKMMGGYASGRRAGLLELAEHCDGMCADKAWHPLIRQGYQNAASHARAMADQLKEK